MPSQSIVFDRAAEYYDATRGFPPGVEQPIAELIAQAGRVSAQSRVLEIGIGTGRIALPLAQATGATIYGADLSLPMMHKLRQKQRGEHIHLAQADVTLLPFPANAFDAVVAVHVFHLIPNWQDALREVGRVLKPSALFINAGSRESGESDPLQKLRDAYRAIVPPGSDKRPGVRQEDYATFPLTQGWRSTGEPLTHHYTITLSPNQLIENTASRVFSNCWLIPDELVQAGVVAMRAAAQQEFADLNQPAETKVAFNVRTYAPPEG